jgi:hypothetical protein
MADVVKLYQANETITFDVLRDGKTMKIHVTLGQRPDVAGSQSTGTRVVVREPVVEAVSTPQGELAFPQEPPIIDQKAQSDHDKVILLEQHVAELERRVIELEKRLKEAK